MRLALSWLKQFVAVESSVDDIAASLVRLGHEVEAIEYPRASLNGVIVGKIVSMDAHPNADRLKLLKVDIGANEPLSIVCGANNMQAGDKIPVATIGSSLPNGMKIKKGKVRGEASFGMCCSEVELGLADESDGLMILPEATDSGRMMGEYLELEEAIIELSITPNRGDCMSVLGLARELAADFDLPLAAIELNEADMQIDHAPSIRGDAEDDCPYYTARLIEGVTITAAPTWLQQYLLAAGQRSVNGVVDALNYVMFELGQPMHAFDGNRVHGALHIRHAEDGETFDGLDGRKISLNKGDLLIADEQQVLAMAGIMGSMASGVTAESSSIVLESAFFRPARISLTRRTHGTVSEASMRFERGVDPAQVAAAMHRATELILRLFGGQAGPIKVCGDDINTLPSKEITVDVDRIARRLGLPITEGSDAVLQRMGFLLERNNGTLHITVPSWRHDVNIAEDLSEEYARIIGYDQLPSILPESTIRCSMAPTDMVAAAINAGFVQVVSYAFISSSEQQLFCADPSQDVKLSNPISEAMAVMRRSIWPGLLNAARHNMNRQQKGVALVELGRTYARQAEVIQETNQVAWLVTGEVESDQWYGKARHADFFDLKGSVEHYLAEQGHAARILIGQEHQGLQLGQQADILVGRNIIGCLGRVDGSLAEKYDLDAAVFVAEINLDLLPARKAPKFSKIPEFPSVERDLVFLLADTISANDLLSQLRKGADKTLLDLRVFDVYQGEGIAKGFYSIGVRLTLQAKDRTLLQDECDAIVEVAVKTIADKLGGVLR